MSNYEFTINFFLKNGIFHMYSYPMAKTNHVTKPSPIEAEI